MRHVERVPIGGIAVLRRFAVGAPPERRMARVGQGILRCWTGAAVQMQIGRGDLHIRAQLVHRQPLGQHIRLRRVRIEQHVVALRLEEEISQVFALRRQHRGIDQPRVEPSDIIGDKPLQEHAGVAAAEAQDAAGGDVHRAILLSSR